MNVKLIFSAGIFYLGGRRLWCWMLGEIIATETRQGQDWVGGILVVKSSDPESHLVLHRVTCTVKLFHC